MGDEHYITQAETKHCVQSIEQRVSMRANCFPFEIISCWYGGRGVTEEHEGGWKKKSIKGGGERKEREDEERNRERERLWRRLTVFESEVSHLDTRDLSRPKNSIT